MPITSQTRTMTPADSPRLDWYFDFLSPFAYLQHELLRRVQPPLTLNYQPVLFAGLLKYWGGKGPAEIPAKRVLTYQHCQYVAEQHGIAMRFPPAHPFNPLPALRLAIVGHCTSDCITTIFHALYADGADLNQPEAWQRICQQLSITDGAKCVAEPWVKDQLRTNTEQSAQRGVFGVPTLIIAKQLFWGLDMTDMALEYLQNPQRFHRDEYQRLASLPIGQARKI